MRGAGLEPGDLVFYGGSGYYGHVAIYAGRGPIIEAPHTGAVVSHAKLQGAATAHRLLISAPLADPTLWRTAPMGTGHPRSKPR